MRLIISPIKIELLQKYDFPKDKYGNIDLEGYYKTPEGADFFSITPLVIDWYSNKKELAHHAAFDISWLSLCYNCPLYIYVMTDSWYSKNLGFSNLKSRRNFGKCKEMTNLRNIKGYDLNSPEINALRIEPNVAYYKNDIDKIEEEVSKIILNREFNMKEKPIWCIKLTVKSGFSLI